MASKTNLPIPYLSLLKVSINSTATIRLLLAAILSFSLSIAIILSTLGLMRGFEQSLKQSLVASSGEISIHSRQGFFVPEEIGDVLDKRFSLTNIIQSQAFALKQEDAKGVIVYGVNRESFNQVSSLGIEKLAAGEVLIGKELAHFFSLKNGDELALVFASGGKKIGKGLAQIERFRIVGIVEHGIYERDLRVIYLNQIDLARIIGTSKVNLTLLNRQSKQTSIEDSIDFLKDNLPHEFSVKPFWHEFTGLLRAVEVEKLSITIILQLIVVIAIFNIAAFIIFLSEKKSQEFFLLSVLGLRPSALKSFWLKNIFIMWFISAITSIGLTRLFDFLIQRLSVFNLPGKIYVLSSLRIELRLMEYIIVFSLALIWMLIIIKFIVFRSNRQSLLSAMRKEFQ